MIERGKALHDFKSIHNLLNLYILEEIKIILKEFGGEELEGFKGNLGF